MSGTIFKIARNILPTYLSHVWLMKKFMCIKKKKETIIGETETFLKRNYYNSY